MTEYADRLLMRSHQDFHLVSRGDAVVGYWLLPFTNLQGWFLVGHFIGSSFSVPLRSLFPGNSYVY